jgi:type IV pilus assembly protein PilO
MEFGKLSPGAQIAIIGILLAALVLTVQMMLFANIEKDIKGKETELNGLEMDIHRGKITAAKLQEFKRETERLEARFKTMLRILPERKDTEDLLRKVQSLAVDSNLQVIRFDPQPLVTREFYAEYPIMVHVVGSYYNLVSFFEKISKLPRIINIGGLEIRAVPQGANSITANCVAVTFVFIG